MVPGAAVQPQAARAVLRRPPADRRHHRGVLRRPGTGDVRQVRRWLVLVGPPARLFASRSGDWSVCYELLSLSACDVTPRHRPSLNKVLKWAAQSGGITAERARSKEFLLHVLPYCFRA